VQKSYSSDGASGSGGIAGTGGTDIPGYPGTTEGGKVNSEEFSKIVNSEVDRIQNVIEFSPFSVNDLTISVGIDDQALTPENRIDIERALVSIVAISLADSSQQFTAEQLNSKVTIIAQPFESNTQSALSANMMYLLYGGGAVAIIATGGIIYLVSRNRRRQREQEALEAEIAAAAPTAQQFPTIDIDSVTNESQMRKQIELLVQRKPENFVNLLRTWLVDE
jgi:flagellar M-ring protein FliF